MVFGGYGFGGSQPTPLAPSAGFNALGSGLDTPHDPRTSACGVVMVFRAAGRNLTGGRRGVEAG
jgi:hypothetical protein